MNFKKKFTIIVVVLCVFSLILLSSLFTIEYYDNHPELPNSNNIVTIFTLITFATLAIIFFLIYLPFRLAKNAPDETKYGRFKKEDEEIDVMNEYLLFLSGIDNKFDREEIEGAKIDIITKTVQLRMDCYIFIECIEFSKELLSSVMEKVREILLSYYGEGVKRSFSCVTVYINASKQSKDFMDIMKEGLGYEYREYYFIAGTTPGSVYMYHTQCDFGPAQAMHNKMKKRFYKVLGVKKKKNQE